MEPWQFWLMLGVNAMSPAGLLGVVFYFGMWKGRVDRSFEANTADHARYEKGLGRAAA